MSMFIVSMLCICYVKAYVRIYVTLTLCLHYFYIINVNVFSHLLSALKDDHRPFRLHVSLGITMYVGFPVTLTLCLHNFYIMFMSCLCLCLRYVMFMSCHDLICYVMFCHEPLCAFVILLIFLSASAFGA